MSKADHSDPFPNLPRRFGSFRSVVEVEGPADQFPGADLPAVTFDEAGTFTPQTYAARAEKGRARRAVKSSGGSTEGNALWADREAESHPSEIAKAAGCPSRSTSAKSGAGRDVSVPTLARPRRQPGATRQGVETRTGLEVSPARKESEDIAPLTLSATKLTPSSPRRSEMEISSGDVARSAAAHELKDTIMTTADLSKSGGYAKNTISKPTVEPGPSDPAKKGGRPKTVGEPWKEIVPPISKAEYYRRKKAGTL